MPHSQRESLGTPPLLGCLRRLVVRSADRFRVDRMVVPPIWLRRRPLVAGVAFTLWTDLRVFMSTRLRESVVGFRNIVT
jgi:hypothetical protein